MNRYLTLFLGLLSAQALAQPFPGLNEAIARGDAGHIKAVLISRDGELIHEAYFRGATASDLQVMNSVTKSVGSALIGIAHRRGLVELDDPLEQFFGDLYPMDMPPYQSKRGITVEQVLQQRHGLLWDELSTDYTSASNPTTPMIQSDDWYQFVLSRPLETQPGQAFAYSTGVSTLMSRIVRVVSGMGPDEFAMQALFGPLGIDRVRWEGSDGLGNPNGFTLWPNPDRDPSLGFTLWLRPQDMLKIGELYLNGGLYEGRRILDQSWIEATRIPYSNASNSGFFAGAPDSGYGYQWWVAALTDSRGRKWPMFYASGWGRQYILLLPELDLVVVSVANDYDYDGPGIGAMLNRYVLPELAPRIDQRFDGAWYNPATDGQGLTLQVLDDGQRLLGFWYTYDDLGNQRWFTLDGAIDGSASEVIILETRGGVFLAPDAVTRTEWGRGRLITIDCNHISLEIDASEVTTSIPLTRLTGQCSGKL